MSSGALAEKAQSTGAGSLVDVGNWSERWREPQDGWVGGRRSSTQGSVGLGEKVSCTSLCRTERIGAEVQD